MKFDDSVLVLNGVGEKTEKLFHKLGIGTIRELVSFYPREYEVFEKPSFLSKWQRGKNAVVYAKVTSTAKNAKIGKMTLTRASAIDEHGDTVGLTWFNQPYLASVIKSGRAFVFRGKLSAKYYQPVLEQPAFYEKTEYMEICEKMLPVYPLTKGITRNLMMKCLKQVLEEIPETDWDQLSECPEELRKKFQLGRLYEAYCHIHFPKSEKKYLEARKRIALEEFLHFLIRVKYMKRYIEQMKNENPIRLTKSCEQLEESLPFSLTKAQKKVWGELAAGMSGEYVMRRMVQGDVGSGKTVLCDLAIYACVQNKRQAVFMAPTGVLARQHYEGFVKMMEQFDPSVKTVLLTGSLTQAQKRKIREQIRTHEADVVIGTHAVFQEAVEYDNLGLVITDEQHRFGVKQREALTKKGNVPHTIVMSATPIPRTLGMILYGDLDISVLDEKPANRLPIKNCVVDVSYREKAYAFIQSEVENGHQAFVICSMVEESEEMDGENTIDYSKMLKERFPSLSIAVLHGRMKAEEKEKTMEKFAGGDIQILVSTTVVEVGVDVPNATVMMIEDAQKFGLAQLHQLRGRVGRGSAQGYCIFVCTNGDPKENERLMAIGSSNDGFFLANEDLRLRGPGDITGIVQSGELSFRLADIYSDERELKEAAKIAEEIVAAGMTEIGEAGKRDSFEL